MHQTTALDDELMRLDPDEIASLKILLASLVTHTGWRTYISVLLEQTAESQLKKMN